MKGTRIKLREASSPPAPVPAEFDDAVVWAAWLYYVDQLTQSEVADILNLSRATIVAMLQEARERGIVKIRIDTEVASRTRLSRAIAARFGLEAVSVIPSLGGTPLIRRLGEAGARVLADMLEPDDILGVAWGRTVLAVARAMPTTDAVSPLTVVQVAGSSPGSSADFSPELCSSLLATRLGARCVNLLAPVVVSSQELRDRLLAEPALVKQWALIRSVNRILFGVGDLGPSATVREADMTGEEIIDDYQAHGAVATIIGRFIDDGGQPVPGDLDRRMIGITPDELKSIPVRLCVAGGPLKIEALRGTLAGGYATHLVTDQETGEAILKD